ncbi:MAG: LuxR C-terminal-related transcriptional regulator [Negativicutes bacterium]|nr:LuxR C-terminal-related transcriptional regulator [Negativicutes bacterium]
MPRTNARTLYKRAPINRLLGNMWEYPLMVVEAPMGYGKTTAVKEYLKDCKAEILWLTLLDESAAVFWSGFSRLLQKVDRQAADALAAMGVPGDSVFLDEAVGIVSRIEFPGKTVIVLDDYHVLMSEDIDRFIELLVRSEIPNLHVVIASRSSFGDNSTELVLKGYSFVVGKNCFELSKAEIIEYCRLCGIRPTAEDADFLLSYTEGWISAVYLCILGFLQDGRIERQVSLNELIEKVVYRRCSPEAQEFLLSVCIFDEFSVDQAEHMWLGENAAELLQQLVAQNAFIKHDQVNAIYYMHNIFTGYLRRLFGRQTTEKQQAVWGAAAKWHQIAGDCVRAMDYFYKAADFENLLTTLEGDKGSCITNEHKERLIRYFSECPAGIKMDHPWACLIYAINLFAFNEMELFARQCEEIGGYIENSPGMDDATRMKLAGELELLLGFTKYNSIAGMSEHHQRAWELLQGPAEFMDRSGSWTFGSPSVLYMFYRESGQLAQEEQEIGELLPYYCRLTDGHGFGADRVMQAERYYYIGDFENAEIMAHKAFYAAETQNQTAIALCARFLQLRLALVRGDLTFVRDNLRQTREDIKARGLYLYIHTWDMCEGFVYAYLNQEKRIPAWIIQGDLADSAVYFPSYAFFNIVLGKALLSGGQYLKLIGLAEEFMAIAGVFPNLLSQVYTHIYEAAARLRLGRREEALTVLGAALDIAAADQVIMPFVENGEYIDELLSELETGGRYQDFIGKMRKFLPGIAMKQAEMAAELNGSDGKALLTEREMAIAELVATGLSNRAVGKTLYIAEVTVKKALQGIYAKLGVSSRTALTKLLIEQKTG